MCGIDGAANPDEAGIDPRRDEQALPSRNTCALRSRPHLARRLWSLL
jgi:hypothetical protein